VKTVSDKVVNRWLA